MKLTVFQVHKPWAAPAALVLIATGLADCFAVWFAKRPVLWAAAIASSLPISLFAFVILPMLRRQSREP